MITDWIARWALYAPASIALEEYATGRVLSYRELHLRVGRAARLLADEAGIAAGDRIAVLAVNELDHVVLFLAAQRLGAILVPVNTRLAPRELGVVFADCTPALLVTQHAFDETLARIPQDVRPARTSWLDGDDGITAQLDGMTDTQDASRDRAILEGVHADDHTVVMILYTSGTTGVPKGAMITHGMLFWNSINTSLRLNLTQSDVTLTFAPFFHTGGWNVLTTPFLHRGARVVLLRRFDPDLVLRLCDELGVTILFGVPTMMDMMFRAPGFASASLSSVRYAIVGGEPMPIELIRNWQDKGVPVRQGYGLTEFGPNVFSLNEEDAIRRIGSIGFPNFYIDARVVDDSGRPMPDGEVGELVLRGPVCTPGYWNNPEATAEAIRDGWFHTGDLVRRDEDGYYYVVDRKKDMFISGAENVYPAEIERFLRTLPGVAAVAVIGVPDPVWGESGRAFVVREPGSTVTEDDILAACAGNLARYKIPRSVRFLEALPVGESGKLLKRALKELP